MSGPKEYLFDVKLFAAIRITATDEAAARAKLEEMMEYATVCMIENGIPQEPWFEASMDGEADLVEIDGQEVN